MLRIVAVLASLLLVVPAVAADKPLFMVTSQSPTMDVSAPGSNVSTHVRVVCAAGYLFLVSNTSNSVHTIQIEDTAKHPVPCR